jgi:cytochrome P450
MPHTSDHAVQNSPKSALPKQVPHIPFWRTIIDAPKAVKDPVSWFSQLTNQYGENVKLRVPNGQHILLTSSPGLIRHVLQGNHRQYGKTWIQTQHLAAALGKGLLTSEGEYWLRQRRLIQPGFHRDKLAALAAGMQDELERSNTEFDGLSDSGKTVDVLSLMMRLTFRIVSRSLFSTDMPPSDLDRVEYAVGALQRHLVITARRPWVKPWLRINGGYRDAAALKDEVDQMLFRIIDERLNNGSGGHDLLDMLVEARYEDSGQGMTREQLRDETVILYAAGHETSANAMTWMLDQVSRNAEVEEKLLNEIATLTPSQLAAPLELLKLPYTRMVVQESLRCFPPAWATDRISKADDEFEGISIPAGQVVLLFIYGAHHHPDFWTNPEQFNPDRFGENGDVRGAKEAFLPFGGGPRLCIGNNFAMMEMQLALIHLIRHYRFVPTSPNTPAVEPLITLKPLGGMPMKLERRLKQ